MARGVSVSFISLVASCFGLWEEERQTAHPMSFTWVSHIAVSVLMGPNQSINNYHLIDGLNLTRIIIAVFSLQSCTIAAF